ncbi:hemerythrin domain-containing protein [Desulfocurvibacter africanus]|uniref:Hemerythrin HHE cation binding domain protein n=1 Tax=Desulfocurvibacter africanus subsp. africanus str. Walvis Bay TaxID=690850 RepID=F3YV43_DESAF|nr:hemerythrin domain-containing protein [Desulfocurvibacter africanus]EGJ49293.1 Hemerythrin HHE cation binding domain protein [Desulfocurvibacter africanus subsp. africanus str. Walvis Bay]
MQPIGPLMHEHRLIERMITLMGQELEWLKRGEEPDLRFIDHSTDFFLYFADACHHGKEDQLLFPAVLAKQDLEERYRKLTVRLQREHIYARSLTQRLEEAAHKRRTGGGTESVQAIMDALHRIVQFYPRHIMTEDKEYFHQVMECFGKDEQQTLLREFDEVEKRVLHERYQDMVREHEEGQQGRKP